MSNEIRVFVLVHSPLVGPLTWSLVGEELQKRGRNIIIPELLDPSDSREPFWKQHAQSVSQALAPIPSNQALVLVAHSGAGPLLPVIRESLANPVHAYVFVDAGIPRDAASRLDLMKLEDPDWAEQFEERLKQGEQFPTWSPDELSEIIPDEDLRRQLVDELHPRGLAFFTESIPVFKAWPDAPCVYIQFSAAYNVPAVRAREWGWPVKELTAGHFHMLVDPPAVTDIIERSPF